MNTVTMQEWTRAEQLPEAVRTGTRDLILVLADSKRLLGMRYANWILGAPELEAGIACSSMAQDEWGHARLLYALLRDFGDDTDQLEHGREPDAYRSIESLDHEPESWPELVAINALVDGALSVQLEALTASAYLPLRQRVQKLLDEESFHRAHATAWFARLASADAACAELGDAVDAVAPQVLRWFGPDSDAARTLQGAGITDAVGSGLRARWLERIAPLIAELGHAREWLAVEPDFDAFDETARRTIGTAPDARTIAQVRGDLNRAFLMD